MASHSVSPITKARLREASFWSERGLRPDIDVGLGVSDLGGAAFVFPGVTSRVVGGMGRCESLVCYPASIVPLMYTSHAKAQ